MTDEKRSHNWPLIVIVVLCGFLTVAIFSALDQSRKRKEAEAKLETADSVSYHVSKRVMEENSMLREKVADNDHFKGDVLAWVQRAANAWDRERRGYWRQISERDSIITELRKHVQ